MNKFPEYFNIKIAPTNLDQLVEFDMEEATHEFDSFIKDTQL